MTPKIKSLRDNLRSLARPSTISLSAEDVKPARDYIKNYWTKLERFNPAGSGSLVSLPKPYLVPAYEESHSFDFNELYYWDSYFIMLGLKISKRWDLIANMINNFAWLIDQYGYIPNGNRTYYLGRSQPPFFACMVNLLSEEKPAENSLVKYLSHLQKEYDFWMKGSKEITVQNPSLNRVVLMPDENILNHYWDENDTPRPESFKDDSKLAASAKDTKKTYRHLRAAAESGWDFSSRWFKNKNDFATIHTTDIIPVDLNCLLVNLEKTIAKAFRLSGNLLMSEKFETLAYRRAQAIDTHCWNEKEGFYFDYDYIENRQKDSFTAAAVAPLFFQIATKEQAAKVAENIKEKFLSPGGLITTTESTDQQWDAPNGWPPLQWMAIKGLDNYGHVKLAKDIANRWMKLNKRVYENTGKMMEKYNVIDTGLTAGGGEYPAQDGFGWTNGVYLDLEKWMEADS